MDKNKERVIECLKQIQGIAKQEYGIMRTTYETHPLIEEWSEIIDFTSEALAILSCRTGYPFELILPYNHFKGIFTEIFDWARTPTSPFSTEGAFHEWMKENYPMMEMQMAEKDDQLLANQKPNG